MKAPFFVLQPPLLPSHVDSGALHTASTWSFNCLLAKITVVFLLGFRSHYKYSSQWRCVCFLSWQFVGEASALGHLAATVIRRHGKRGTEIRTPLSKYLSPRMMRNGPPQAKRKGLDFLNSLSIWQKVLNLVLLKSRPFFNWAWRRAIRNKHGVSASRNSNCDWRWPLRILPQGSQQKYYFFDMKYHPPFDGAGWRPVWSGSLLLITPHWATCQYGIRVK